jgi:hypothetical protein
LGETLGRLCRTLSTVPTDTPARSAISFMRIFSVMKLYNTGFAHKNTKK